MKRLNADIRMQIKDTHRDICLGLNIDASTAERSWRTFEKIQSVYDLTNDKVHWLCCALYVACLQAATPTVGNAATVIQGNCVSVTSLLKLCGVSFHDFSIKIDQWANMASLPTELMTCIHNLKHHFAVSINAYHQFNEIFPKVFNTSVITPDEQRKNKKAKPKPCSVGRLKEFVWLLFICMKMEYPEHKSDILTSVYMIVCCMDLIYSNVVSEGRLDLINAELRDRTADETTDAGIIPLLCEKGTIDSVLEVKQSIWQQALEELIRKKDLRGEMDDNLHQYVGLVMVSNFEDNLKSLHHRYDQYILRYGEFDERIPLGLLANNKHERSQSLTPKQTPMKSGASYLAASNSVNRLLMKLRGSRSESSRGSLSELLTPAQLDILTERMNAERERFTRKMTEDEGWNALNVQKRFEMIEALYYQLLEGIIRAEINKRSSLAPTVVVMLCADHSVNQTIVVCSAVIVFYVYNQQHNFDWILKIFDMTPFVFYRIIELIVASNSDWLTRDIIEYLSKIEDRAMDSLCWQSSSPLWEKMDQISYQIPTNTQAEFNPPIRGITPLKNDCCAKMHGSQQTLESAATPVGAITRKVLHPDSAKKKLFSDSSPSSAEEENPRPSSSHHTNPTTSNSVTSTETASSSTSKEPLKDTSSGSAGFTINQHPAIISSIGFKSPYKPTPQNGGSLTKNAIGTPKSLDLFFRKFYYTAYLRMNNLCKLLGLDDHSKRVKIWTLFEYSITNCAKELMRDRHLDQMLMCAIYVFVKITKLDKKFADIMKHYREQPKSVSDIYRNVFIRWLSEEEAQQLERERPEQSQQNGVVSPSEMALASIQHGREERGDIIKFYNTIYVPQMQTFSMNFANSTEECNLLLSPPPKAKSSNVLQSPRKIIDNVPLYVTLMDHKSELREDACNSRVFMFQKSPKKDFDEIKSIVQNAKTCKRSLANPVSFEPSSKTRKLNKIHQDRQQQEANYKQ